MFQNSCPSLYGADCPKGMLCLQPSLFPTSSFRCPNEEQNREAKATCTGADYLNDDHNKNKFFALKCPSGQFCATSTEVENCPDGHFCTSRSTVPQACDAGALCSANAQYPVATIIIALGILLLVGYQVIASWVCGRTSKKTAAPPTATTAEAPTSTTEQVAVAGLEFAFSNLGLHKYGKQLLQGVTGTVRRGELLAVMGPSGAGKTTFMNVLTGKILPTTGSVHINGFAVAFEKIRALTGFVPQNDIMLTDLTVGENLQHSANTRIIGDAALKALRVTQVLAQLGMSHVRDSTVGDDRKRGLSGGERKRVSIGMELVANPAVICLDEPTTGLDSASAEVVVDV